MLRFKPRNICGLICQYQRPCSFQVVPEKDAKSDKEELTKRAKLVFTDAQEVFGYKSTRDLWRGYFVLHTCAIEPLVRRSLMLMKIGERILGSGLLGKLLSPFYYQFVAGDDKEDMKRVAENLKRVGIHLMIAPMLETDIGETEDNEDELFKKNLQKTLALISLSSSNRPTSKGHLRPVCQTKITAHISADILYNIGPHYDHLNEESRACVIQSLGTQMKILSESNDVSPLTDLRPLRVTPTDMKAINSCLERLTQIGRACKDQKVILAVDAEHTYTNSAISLLTLAMMFAFNKEFPVVWNTYQAYLKGNDYWLQHDLQMVKSFGIYFGAKIVRGAYMEKEREYARATGQPCRVHETYELTNKMYDSLIDYLVPIVAKSCGKCHFVAATHNEASVLNVTRKIAAHGLPSSCPHTVFAQIYGMAENISVPLAKAGYSVYKSVPYGSMKEVLPYLSRRANENRAVFRGARRERRLLSQELWRRMKI